MNRKQSHSSKAIPPSIACSQVPVTALNHHLGLIPAGAAAPPSASRFGWMQVNAGNQEHL